MAVLAAEACQGHDDLATRADPVRALGKLVLRGIKEG